MEAHQLRDVVPSILHAILFTRLLHNPHPVTTHTVNIADSFFSYCKLQDADIEKAIDAVIQQLITNDNIVAEKTITVTISVNANNKKGKKQHGWLMMRPRGESGVEVVEMWTVNVKMVPLRSQDAALLTKAVQDSLIYISSSPFTGAISTSPTTDEPEDDQLEVSYRLEVVGGTESLASMFKRMLSDSNIPPLLG